VKKYLLPVAAGVVVFGVVTAFAASLAVSSPSLGAGNATVASCQDNADVTYATTGANVGTATVTFSGTGAGCNGLTAEVTLTGTDSLDPTPASGTGVVTSGVATVDFSSVPAHDVTGVAVVVTG
jgi:hypothetical protein